MIKLTMVLLALVSTNVFAVYSYNKSVGDVIRALKEGPLSLTLSLSNEGLRDANDQIKGVDTVLETLFNYDQSDKHDYRIYAYSGITFDGNGGEQHGLDFIEFRHRLKNLFTEEEHGFTLNSEHRIGKMASGRWRNDNDQAGYIQHRFHLNKKISDTFTIDFISRVQLYSNISKVAEKTKNLYRFYVWPGWTLTDRVSVSTLLMYSFSDRRAASDNSYLLVEPQISYQLGKDVSASVYLDLLPLKSNDGQLIADNIFNKSTLGLNLTANVF